jgi:Zn-dependent M28 family amino/carboxypeptidase
MKRYLPLFLLFALLLSSCGKIGGPTSPSGPAAQGATLDIATLEPLGTPMPKYGDVARALMRDFANIGPRPAGSAGDSQAAQYVTTVFQAIGYSPETQTFTAADSKGQQVTSANIMAVKKGTSNQEIIVASHYDSPSAGPGADEASGVAVMLEVARMLAGQNTPYTIRFIAFGGTDSGLLGSYAYVNQMSQEEFENLIAMVDLDQLTAGDGAYGLGDEGVQSGVRDWSLEWAHGNGLDLQTVRDVALGDPQTGKGVSDYSAFRDVGIPYVFFWSTNFNLGDKKGDTQVDARFGEKGKVSGTKFDTLEYLDKNFPGRVDQRLNLFVTVVYNLLVQYEVPIQ